MYNVNNIAELFKVSAIIMDIKDTEDHESKTAANYDIFVSHSHEDYDKVTSVLEYLKDENRGFGLFFPVFIAHKDIEPTKKWEDEIFRVLTSTKIFITYLTPNFKQSNWCDQETGIAYATKQKVISIIGSDDTTPYGFIGKYQGMHTPEFETESGRSRLEQKMKKFAVSIIKLIHEDDQFGDWVRERIFSRIKDIKSFSQTDLVFSLLEYMKPFSNSERDIILGAYYKNTQIKDAYSADSLVKKLQEK